MQVRTSTFFGNIFQGAKSGGEMESAQAKNQALRDAGAVVPTSYEAFEGAIKEAFDKLVRFSLSLPILCCSCISFASICTFT